MEYWINKIEYQKMSDIVKKIVDMLRINVIKVKITVVMCKLDHNRFFNESFALFMIGIIK